MESTTMPTEERLFSFSNSFDRVPGQLNVAFHWHIFATENRRLPVCMVQVEGK